MARFLIVSRAEFMGLDEKRRQRGGTPAVVECNDIRFFSLAARDLDEADRINAAADKLVSEVRKAAGQEKEPYSWISNPPPSPRR